MIVSLLNIGLTKNNQLTGFDNKNQYTHQQSSNSQDLTAGMNVCWLGPTTSLTTFLNIRARTLANILQTLPTKLMNLNFLMSFGQASLGIKLIKVAFNFP